MEFILSLLSANLLTLIIETPIYYYLIKKRSVLILFIYIILNIISNLSLNLIYTSLIDISYIIFLLEFFVFIIEGIILYSLIDLIVGKNKFSFKKLLYYLIVSFISNAISFSFGSILNELLFKDKDLNFYIYVSIIYFFVFISIFIFLLIYTLLKEKKD